MKTMTCAQMGGMCDSAMTASNEHEMMTKGMQHLEEAHPEMAASVKALPQDHPEMVKWAEKFHTDFEALPESV